MKNSAKLKEYKITKINLDMDSLQNGENNIRLSTSIKILVPKDLKDENYVVEIKTSFKIEEGKNILTVGIQGISEIILNNPNETISKDEKNELIKKYVVPDLYEKLRKYVDDLLERSHIEFIGIPPFESINETT